MLINRFGILFLSLTFVLACKNEMVIANKPYDFIHDSLRLTYLQSYLTSKDTINNEIAYNYSDLGIKRIEKFDRRFAILNDKDTLLIGNSKNHSYLFEIFKKSFLIVSFVNGKSGASGPDNFKRDFVYILDIKTFILKELNLENIYLTISPDYLAHIPVKETNEDFLQSLHKSCAIADIDFSKNTVILVNRNYLKLSFKLREIKKPLLLN